MPQTGPDPEPATPGRYQVLTRPVILLGDTQEHESTGVPLHDNDSAIDAYVEVTQRPPEQPLFGRRILEWVLQAHPGEPFLHMGDVLDLSCRAEAARMNRIFAAAARPGAILPGNHDGLMFGVYGYNAFAAATDPGAKKWETVCRRGAGVDDQRHKTAREAFTKRDFIATYLAEHATGPGALQGLTPPPAEGEHRLRWRNPDRHGYLSAIEARLLDGKAYSDSFLAQRLLLPRAPQADRDVIVIALDTNQAGPLVTAWDTLMGRSPGSVGHVKRDQIAAIRPWVLQAAANGDIVVFAGHHNWSSLGLPSRILLRDLMSDVSHPLVYLSAHTHRGFWAVHRALDRRPLLELNVSSLSDWPIAYRQVSFAYDAAANRLRVRADLLPGNGRAHERDADLLAAWDAGTCAQAGVKADELRTADRELVRRQRASRGSLLAWLREEVSLGCTACEYERYARANAYQDDMLLALIETRQHLGDHASMLDAIAAPPFCQGEPWHRCASRLIDAPAGDLTAQRDLFRRKATLVDRVGSELDALVSTQAKAYMTCRAIQAARVDFEETPDDRNSHRGEAKRRAEQFFRLEASVGND